MNNTPVVVVTGASRGLGAAVASWLGKAGAAVTLIARSKENLGKTGDAVRQLGGKPLICRADVAQYDACPLGREIELGACHRSDVGEPPFFHLDRRETQRRKAVDRIATQLAQPIGASGELFLERFEIDQITIVVGRGHRCAHLLVSPLS